MYLQTPEEMDTLCSVYSLQWTILCLQKVLLFFFPFPRDLICRISHEAVVQDIYMKWPLSFTDVSLTSWIPATLCWDDCRVDLD